MPVRGKSDIFGSYFDENYDKYCYFVEMGYILGDFIVNLLKIFPNFLRAESIIQNNFVITFAECCYSLFNIYAKIDN
jgi:hypothetical protein